MTAHKVRVRKHRRKKPKSKEKTTVREHTRHVKKKRKSKKKASRIPKPRRVKKLGEFLREKGYSRYITPFGTVLIDPSHTMAVGCSYTLRNILYSHFADRKRKPKYKRFKLYGIYNDDGLDILVFKSGRSYIFINPKLYREAMQIVGKDATFHGYLKDTPLIFEAKGRPAVMIAPLRINNFEPRKVEVWSGNT